MGDRRRGLGLVETMVAMWVLAIILISLFTLFPSGALATRLAESRIQADNLAHSLLEDLRGWSWDELGRNEGTLALPDVTASGVTFRPVRTIGPAASHVRELTVTVRWSYRDRVRGVQHQVLVHHLRPR
ncbi:MAG: hypothetical protein AB1758_35800 [Candidatus Eremiobacterota bacterium]